MTDAFLERGDTGRRTESESVRNPTAARSVETDDSTTMTMRKIGEENVLGSLLQYASNGQGSEKSEK